MNIVHVVLPSAMVRWLVGGNVRPWSLLGPRLLRRLPLVGGVAAGVLWAPFVCAGAVCVWCRCPACASFGACVRVFSREVLLCVKLIFVNL